MARPTSRWAIAKRVTESIISITSAPSSRKYSAIAVAVNAAFKRTSAGWSEVATTTTERASPSGPRSRSMNSRTSRPRSPTRQMTLTCADVERAIIPSSEDLPAPEAVAGDRAETVDRAAEAVDRPAEQRVGDVDAQRLAARAHPGARADAR